VILIENKASGTQLIQELREAGVSAVTRYKPKAIRSCASIPKPAPWKAASCICPHPAGALTPLKTERYDGITTKPVT
jgi:hypothetical protein